MSNRDSNNHPEERRWALLVYIAGDNNLSDHGLKDIQEMCDEGASRDVHVGVEIDTRGELDGSIRYEITEPDYTRKGHRTVIERISEKDTGDPETLLDFLEWGMERYPAKNRLVVVSGHGAGFRRVSRDIGYDWAGSSLDMPEIETVFKRAKITSDNKLQILGFDACLMNMLEVVHHFCDQVEIVVGSQQTEPGDGWPYDRVLKKAKAADKPEDLAKGIVRVYKTYYEKKGIENVTHSAVYTEKTKAVVDSVHDLGKLLTRKINGLRSQIRSIRVNTQSFFRADYVDLIRLCELIAAGINDQQISSKAQEVISAARDCIITNKKLGSAVTHAHGLSIWFPPGSWIYLNCRAKYMELKCNSSSFGWTDFLDAYHS